MFPCVEDYLNAFFYLGWFELLNLCDMKSKLGSSAGSSCLRVLIGSLLCLFLKCRSMLFVPPE
jgi:hypothetical protein